MCWCPAQGRVDLLPLYGRGRIEEKERKKEMVALLLLMTSSSQLEGLIVGEFLTAHDGSGLEGNGNLKQWRLWEVNNSNGNEGIR